MLTRLQKRKREEGVLEEPNSINECELTDGNGRNPLLNDVVLGCLFKMSPLSDLKRFRLVSKQWYSLTLARCRQEMTVVIRPPTYAAGQANAAAETETGVGLEWALLERKLDVGDQPFRSYRLFNYMEVIYFNPPRNNTFIIPMDNSLRMLNQHVPLFFSKFGRWIHKLELCDTDTTPGVFDMFAIFEETPNLEKLILNGSHETRNMQGEGRELRIQPNLKYLVFKKMPLNWLPFSWNFFFRHFPNCQNVDCAIDSEFVGKPKQLLPSLMEISQELNNNKKLKFFCSWLMLVQRLPADNLASMRILQLPLVTFEKLTICEFGQYWCGDDVLRQVIATALRHHGNTLKELELTFHPRAHVSFFEEFPFQPGPFTSLTTLELSGEFYKNLSFLGKFPNVSTLKMIEYENKTLRMCGGRMNGLAENIRVFHFSTKSPIPDDMMTIWVDLMPNVEDYAGGLSGSSLRIVCDKWRKLKRLLIESQELRLTKRSISDEAITGMVRGKDERLPNITDLQDLESLVISKPVMLSDASIWNGFLKLPRLKNLSVQLSKKTSEEAYNALLKKFPGDPITRCVRR